MGKGGNAGSNPAALLTMGHCRKQKGNDWNGRQHITMSHVIWHHAKLRPCKSSAITTTIHDGGPLCGLVVRVPGYRSRGPGSISGTTRFSEK
jgi:hypothetical protein